MEGNEKGEGSKQSGPPLSFHMPLIGYMLLLVKGKKHREMEGALLIISAQHLLTDCAYECYQLHMDVEG